MTLHKYIIYFLATAIALLGSTPFALAAQEEAPVVDRIILKKKREEPVVDRIILKKKREEPVVDRIILRKKKPVIEEAPAPPQPEIEELPAPAPTSAPPEQTAALNPIGTVLHLSVASGILDRTQLGLGYWFTDDWGLALMTGVSWRREEGTVTSAAGPRRITTLTYAAVPELSVLYAPVIRKNLRFAIETGGGMRFSKRVRNTTDKPAYHAFLGPAIQWHIFTPLSLQASERIELLVSPNPARYDAGLSLQLTTSWWFE